MQAKWLEKPYHFYSYKEFILSNLRFIYLDETLERPLNKIKLNSFSKSFEICENWPWIQLKMSMYFDRL